MTLTDWTFPANYDTFSVLNENVVMTFKINMPYSPNENSVQNDLAAAIFEALYLLIWSIKYAIKVTILCRSIYNLQKIQYK